MLLIPRSSETVVVSFLSTVKFSFIDFSLIASSVWLERCLYVHRRVESDESSDTSSDTSSSETSSDEDDDARHRYIGNTMSSKLISSQLYKQAAKT